MTEREAKSILFKIGVEFGVSPAKISTKLLSKEDKQDILNDLIPMETLKLAVRLWNDAGQLDYVNR
jgi:hypothetical protein